MDGTQLGQGRDSAIRAMKEDQKMCDMVVKRIMEHEVAGKK
jgi:hypothetical protein